MRSLAILIAMAAWATCGTSEIWGMLSKQGIHLVALKESGCNPHNPKKGISVRDNKSEYETATETSNPNEFKEGKSYIKHFWFQAQSNTTKIFIYFYKPKDNCNTGDYACFANTFEKPDASKDPKTAGFSSKDFSITVDGEEYRSSEHYFQAHKFERPDEARKAMKKMEANQLPDFTRKNKTLYGGVRADWFKGGSIEVMLKAVRAKFSQHEDLGLLLLNTYPNILVEDSAKKYSKNKQDKKDVIWGAGDSYSGGNLLGQILMLVRQELRDGTCYKFVEMDSLDYYKLLSGQTLWEKDQNPDLGGIPDYLDLLNKINKNKTNNSQQNPITQKNYQNPTNPSNFYPALSTILYSGLSALSGLFFGGLQSYLTPTQPPKLTLLSTGLGAGTAAAFCATRTIKNQKPNKLAVFGSALAGFLMGRYAKNYFAQSV